MTPEQSLLDLETCYKREVSAGWEFIRKLALYVDTFGPAYYYEAADHLGLSPKSLRDYASVARNPISTYAESLGLTRAHAQSVLGVDSEDARALLLKAAEEGLSSDWIKYELRMRKPTSSALDAPKPTGSPQTKENSNMDKIYHMEIQTPTAPVSAPHTLSGAVAVHRNWTPDDEVPFAEQELYQDETDTPFEVAERIVDRWA